MRDGDGVRHWKRGEKSKAPSCAGQTPIWRGRLFTVRALNFTAGFTPQGTYYACARLWVERRVGGEIFFAKNESSKGPVDALHSALRAVLTEVVSWTLPNITIVEVPKIGLMHPGYGTQSSAFVQAKFQTNGEDVCVVETQHCDFAIALFLAYCTVYDAALIARYSADLASARLAVKDGGLVDTHD